MTPKELYQSDDLSWLQKPDAEVESISVERKRWADKKEVGRQLSAFANGSREGGVLALGADRDGAIPGIDDRLPQGVNSLLAGVSDAIESCGYETRQIRAPNGRTVLLFFVPFSPKKVICTSDGHAYQRRGDTTVELSDAEIRELRFSRGEESFEDLATAPWRPDLVDQALLNSYLDARRQKNGLTLEVNAEDALHSRGLLRETPLGLMLTNAGVLLFAKSPHDFIPGARLRLLRFEGVTERFGKERNITKDRAFEGPISLVVAQAREFVRTLLRDFDFRGPDGRFVTEPEYPELAWDEAIVNALAHRSYSLANATVYVRIFDDRMEIESPGGFPGPARELKSYPRNPHLMEALRYFELVRWTNEGTRLMHEQMERLGLPPPEFSEPLGSSVLVVLRNDLERRRQRPAVPNVQERWAEIARLLQDPLAIYRRKGLALWEELNKSIPLPPDMVLVAAVAILTKPDLPEKQREPFIDLVRRSATVLPRASLETLITAFTHGRFASTPALEGSVSLILREAPAGREQLIQWLENQPPLAGDQDPRATQIDLALLALQSELGGRELPSPERINVFLSLLRKHSAAHSARRLYEDITGHPLK